MNKVSEITSILQMSFAGSSIQAWDSSIVKNPSISILMLMSPHKTGKTAAEIAEGITLLRRNHKVVKLLIVLSPSFANMNDLLSVAKKIGSYQLNNLTIVTAFRDLTSFPRELLSAPPYFNFRVIGNPICYTQIESNGSEYIIKNSEPIRNDLSNLRSLKLFHHAQWDYSKTRALASFFKLTPNLRDLNFSPTLFEDNSIIIILRSLKHLSNLEYLRLEDCTIGSAGTKAVALSLKSMSKLISLSIGQNRIAMENDDAADTLLTSLKLLPKLQKLDIHNCSLKHYHIKTLATVLKRLTHLTDLTLHGNNINDEGATHLATALPYLTQLKNLDCSHGSITAPGAKAIAEAISTLDQLESLDLNGNTIGDIGGRCIVNACKNMNSLHRLSLNRFKMSPEMQKIIYRIFGPGVIYPEPSMTDKEKKSLSAIIR